MATSPIIKAKPDAGKFLRLIERMNRDVRKAERS